MGDHCVCKFGHEITNIGTCQPARVLETKLTLVQEFTADLLDPNSQAYIDLADKVGDAVKSALGGNAKVKVLGFESGSTVARTGIALDSSDTTNPSNIAGSLNQAMSNGDFDSLGVNKSMAFAVKGL